MKKILMMAVLLIIGFISSAQMSNYWRIEKVDTVGNDSRYLKFTLRNMQTTRTIYVQKVALYSEDEPSSQVAYNMCKKNGVFDTAQYCPVGALLYMQRNHLLHRKYSFILAH